MKIKWHLTVLFVLGMMASLSAQSAADRPNILWIVSEDNSPFIGAYDDDFATTPHLDQLAAEGILYENAYATAPVCAPSRSTLITGMFPTSMGTMHMRSTFPIPSSIRFYPHYLRQAGYYTTNNSKKDYNTVDQPEVWNESSNQATYANREAGQPFFAIFNTTISHESSIHQSIPTAELRHDPAAVPIPPYHPRTEAMEHDWAQYYDKIEEMDRWVGEILAELEASREAENTIVFYYSDHGGILGRSKRFLYESGLHVPLIVRFPEKYQSMAPLPPGSRTDRIVSFIDFAPTLLSLAGVPIPEIMQGTVFLGDQAGPEEDYAYSFRGRMDERIDMSRSIRDERYRYTRNFMPHKIYGQHLEYLWRAPSMQSWAEEFQKGTLNETQSRFFQPKPIEELYDVEADPHNIRNLADDPVYTPVLERMRAATMAWMVEVRDVGLIPEAMIERITERTTMYEYARSDAYPIEEILPRVDLMSRGDIKALRQGLKDDDPVIRYWAVVALINHPDQAAKRLKDLRELAEDEEPAVQIVAAECLYALGEIDLARAVLGRALDSPYEKTRLQALNVLFGFDKAHLEPLMPRIEAIIPDDENNRDYDVRAAKGIVGR